MVRFMIILLDREKGAQRVFCTLVSQARTKSQLTSLRSRRHIDSPGREPGVKPKINYKSPVRGERDFCQRKIFSVARSRGLIYCWSVIPGLTPGAIIVLPADAGSMTLLASLEFLLTKCGPTLPFATGFLQKSCIKGARQKIGNRDFLPLPSQISQDNSCMFAKFPDDLPAGTARRRQRFRIGNDDQVREIALTFRQRFPNRHPLSTNGQTITDRRRAAVAVAIN